MRQKSMNKKAPAERAVRDIRRKARKQYLAEEKIRIVQRRHTRNKNDTP
jgi:transposase